VLKFNNSGRDNISDDLAVDKLVGKFKHLLEVLLIYKPSSPLSSSLSDQFNFESCRSKFNFAAEKLGTGEKWQFWTNFQQKMPTI
jgi:hypothetical protein